MAKKYKLSDSFLHPKDRGKSLSQISAMLSDLRSFKDLRKFKNEMFDMFCTQHGLRGGQLNFLLAVVGAERAKENGFPMRNT